MFQSWELIYISRYGKEEMKKSSQEFETNFDFYCFQDSVTKETIYAEQGDY